MPTKKRGLLIHETRSPGLWISLKLRPGVIIKPFYNIAGGIPK